ncbi:hypothetical protein [Aliarcobacter butzleri]|uniref:hypothetical protein n=1 Tax=Aliarcobacter butzleri TaxID=28197 RepID=UPI0021B558B3|nr:hypothetical protein [Aliarcobacter butzleri]MCT7643877.1 hypothetical protein [Aliarcobacter butzleri]
MSQNNFIYDIRQEKYNCIKAWINLQLEMAEEDYKQNKGEECTRDSAYLRTVMEKINKRIVEQGNGQNKLEQKAKFNPFLAPYYNQISITVKKFFKIGDGWIPSYVALCLLQLYKEKGYKDFEDIDFRNLKAYYRLYDVDDDRTAKNNLFLHLKCAKTIVKKMDEKRVFNKKTKR